MKNLFTNLSKTLTLSLFLVLGFGNAWGTTYPQGAELFADIHNCGNWISESSTTVFRLWYGDGESDYVDVHGTNIAIGSNLYHCVVERDDIIKVQLGRFKNDYSKDWNWSPKNAVESGKDVIVMSESSWSWTYTWSSSTTIYATPSTLEYTNSASWDASKTLYANIKMGDNQWVKKEMTAEGNTYGDAPIYETKFFSVYGGVHLVQFQVYDGESQLGLKEFDKSSKSWSHSDCLTNISSKIYNGSDWVTYGRDFTIYTVPKTLFANYGTPFVEGTHILKANYKYGNSEWLSPMATMTQTDYSYNGAKIYSVTLLATYNVIKQLQFHYYPSGGGDAIDNYKYDGGDAGSGNRHDLSNVTAGDLDGKIYTGYSSGHNWIAYAYDVTLDQQDGSGGSSSVTVEVGSTFPSATMPTRTGYTFGGYYTDEDGEGTQIYDANGDATSAICAMGGDNTLYAKWTANQYSITYKDKGNETFSGTLVDAPDTHTYGIATDLVIPTKANYSFGGWWTDATCTTTRVGTELAASLGATDYTANITLYARWDEIVSLPDTLNKDNLVAYGEKLQFSGDTLDYSHGNNNHRDGYADWKVDIEKCVYTVTIGGRYPNGHNWKLYLISGSDTLSTCDVGNKGNTGWATETKTWNLSGLTSAGVYTIRAKNIREWGEPRLLYIAMDPITVTYDANGGTCATASQVYAGSALTLPTPDSRSGYVFEGWYSGNTKIGAAGGSYSPTASITLTARWGKIVALTDTISKANVATYCDEMSWFGANDEYFDYGPTSATNLTRWARWEVNVVPCEYTISMKGGFPDVGSNAIQWGLILFDGADTVAVYNSIRKDGYPTWTYADKWDLTKNKKTKGDLAAGTYTLEVKNIISWGMPKLKYLVFEPDKYTITYSAGTYGSGSLASGTKIACQDYTISNNSTAFTRSYYTYDSWSTSADGSTEDYDFGETYSTEADLALYPYWELDCSTLHKPSALAASDILDVSATLTITDEYDAPSYDIYYSTTSTAPTSGTTATTTSTSKTKTITGLTASTTYYAWVRAVCDGSNKTDWVAITDGSFSTVATVYAVTIGTVTTNQHSGTTVGGTISASASSAAEGATVTLTATPVSGFGFVEWQIIKTLDASDVTSTVLDGNTLTMPAYNVTVNATFATRYPIYYREDDNETTIPGLEPTYYLYGVGVPSLPTPEKTGYRFDAWYNKWCVIDEGKGWVDGCTKTRVSTTTYGDYIFLAHWTAVEDIAEGCWDGGEYKCGDVPNFNTPNPAGTVDWGTASNWGGGKAPDEDTYVVLPKDMTIGTGVTAYAKEVVLQDGADLTVADGGALIVTDGLTVNSGSDITLGSSIANGNATLIYDISKGLNATVEMASKATTAGTNWTWQYIGSPVNGVHAEEMYTNGYLYKWINGTGWSAVAAKAELEAFAGYCVTYSGAGHVFEMGGALTTTTEKTIAVAAGTAQVIGNSWTAPIQIKQMDASDFNQVEQTIYLFNTGSDVKGTGSEAGSSDRYAPGTYQVLPIASVKSGAIDYTTSISALQGFFVKNESETDGSVTLNYAKHVRPEGENSVINGPMHAPKRITAEDSPIHAVAKLTVSGTRYDDQLILIEHDSCSAAFDNGYDGEKIGESSVSPWIYALRADGTHDAVSATNDLEGAVIGFRAGTTDSQYTMHFDYSDEAEELYLYDTETNTYTQVLTDNTYTFTTSDKEEHPRFTLLRADAPQIATGIENNGGLINGANGVRKVMIDGELYIIRAGHTYNAQGAMVK